MRTLLVAVAVTLALLLSWPSPARAGVHNCRPAWKCPTPTPTPTPTPSPTPTPAPTALFSDLFTGPNATITSSSEYFSSTQNPIYGMDTGTLFRDNNQAYASGATWFRLFTQKLDFASVQIDVDVTVNSWETPSGTDFAGVKIWTRRVPNPGLDAARPVSANAKPALYAVTVLPGPSSPTSSLTSSSGKVFLQKKQQGTSTSDPAYSLLVNTGTGSWPTALGTTYHLTLDLKREGTSIRHRYSRNGVLVFDRLDDGTVGGAVLTSPGAVGVRGDDVEFHFDNFTVTAL